MGPPHIAEVPGLKLDAGDGCLVLWIAEDKAVLRGPAAKGAEYTGIGELGADEIQVGPVFPQVDGQAGLVLAAPGQGHVGPGKGLAVITE